jgi:flagellar basal-body rod protein FlgB
MDLSKLTLFNMSEQRMDYLNQRQKVLALNIANADSPGYRPRDLKAQKFNEMVRSAEPPRIAFSQTSGKHIRAAKVDDAEFRDRKDKVHYETAPAGNAVVIEEQMLKIGETTMQHNTATKLYQKYLQMFKTALGAEGSA